MFGKYKTLIDWQQAVYLTEELIKIETCSSADKREILNYIAGVLGELETQIIVPDAAEPYLISKIASDFQKPDFTLVFEGHLDTVAPGEMREPLMPRIRKGKLYGRGACDMKAGCAAMLLAYKEFARLTGKSGQIYLVFVVDEETASKSIVHALDNNYLPGGDLAVIGEPTELKLGTAHKGIEWLQVSFYGKAGHSSVPQEGINAINMASHFIQVIEEYNSREFPGREHPICGLPTMTIGSIQGGGSFPNVVPDYCELKIDRHFNPNETISDVWNDMDKCISLCTERHQGFKASWKRIGVEKNQVFPSLHFPETNPLYKVIGEAFSEIVGLKIESRGLSFWTEGSLLEKHGIPSIIFGPGSINQAHSSEEYVLVEDVITAAQAYFSLILRTCLKF
ncbi:MAG: M20 family metallopeptidase [Clostridia bacterium]|nr:M20 family metallopeptidase [Clostridia bacterium]